MFDKNATYQKSAAGAEAIAVRSNALTPKLRSLLILVDGKRRFEELAKLGDAENLLPQLVDLGFVEAAAGGAPPSPNAAPNAAPPTGADAADPQRPVIPLAEAKRLAVRRLNDLLGPGADDLCIRIEGTRTVQDFLAAIQRAEHFLRQSVGAQRAAKFAADMDAFRPS